MSNEDKKGLNLSTGNWITIGIFIVGVITAWAKIQIHISDETIHVGTDQVVLSTEEYRDLLNFATTVENKFPTITSNEERLIKIERDDAVHFNQYESLFREHEDLEGKVSRVYKELKSDINKNHENN